MKNSINLEPNAFNNRTFTWAEQVEIDINIFKAELLGNIAYQISWLDLLLG